MVTSAGHEQGVPRSHRSRRSGALLVAVVVAVALTLVLSGAASAASAETTNPKLLQEYTAVVDSLGRAHITDVYTYDPAFFSQHVGEFNDHPSLLTRDLQQQVAMGSVVNLVSKVDPDTSTITLTYETPGYAINMGDHWEIPVGGSSSPTTTSDSSVVFEETYPGASPLTAWQTNDWTWRMTVKTPSGAGGVTWDDGQKQMVYKLAYVPPAPPKTFFQQNKVYFAPLSAILAIGALVGIVIVFMRGRVAAAPAIGPAPERSGIRAADIDDIAAPAKPQGIAPAPRPPVSVASVDAHPRNPVAESTTTPPTPSDEAAARPQQAPAAAAPAPSESAEPPVPQLPEETAPAETAAPAEIAAPVTVTPAGARPRFCSSCGFTVAADAHFCEGCGKALTAS